MARLIGCFTSTPHSAAHAGKTLVSLSKQTVPLDVIYWFYPHYSKRFDMTYPPVTLPPFSHDFRSSLRVIQVEDYGPNTKIAPLLDIDDVHDKDSILIFDDDTVYAPQTVETLVAASQAKPGIGVGINGHTFKAVPFHFSNTLAFRSKQLVTWYNQVRVMLCSGMVLYPRSMFPNSTQEYMAVVRRMDCFELNDDHVMAHLAYTRGVPLFLVSCESSQHYKQEGALLGTNATQKCEIKMMLKGFLPLPWAEMVTVIVAAVLLCYVAYKIMMLQSAASQSPRPGVAPAGRAPRAPAQTRATGTSQSPAA